MVCAEAGDRCSTVHCVSLTEALSGNKLTNIHCRQIPTARSPSREYCRRILVRLDDDLEASFLEHERSLTALEIQWLAATGKATLTLITLELRF